MRKSIFLILVLILLTSCSSETPITKKPTQIANPASVHCQEQGYELEIRTSPDGQYGVCIFPDNSECEEWEYFRGECQPGGEK